MGPFNTRLALTALAVLAALSGLASAQAANDYMASCSALSLSQTAASVIPVVFMLVLVMVSLAYLVGHGLHQPSFELWAKDEFANLLISAVFVIGIFAFFSLGCVVTDSLDQGAVQTSNSPFTIIYKYLDDLGNNYGMKTVNYLVTNSLNQQYKATDYLYLGVPIFGGWGIAQNANYKALSQQNELLIDLAMPAITSIRIQRSIFVFIEQMAFAVILPLALILRAFPFTRDYGNYAIAVVFGLYIVLPLTYVLFANVHYNFVASNPGLFTGGPSYGDAALSDVYWYNLGILFPQAILFPNIAIVITTTAIMSLSRAFRAIAV
ncbi:MAG TPA: hypothetical protein PLO51_03160 [Candidatus Micrarchaeota archaeon]|nr:hypothetical protein [Candidatus Micrarchaeota archaeon]